MMFLQFLIQFLLFALSVTFSIYKGLWIDRGHFTKLLHDGFYVINGVFLSRSYLHIEITQNLIIDLLDRTRQFFERLFYHSSTGLFPDPTVSMCIGAHFRAIQINMLQIYIFLLENVPIDVIEDLIQRLRQLIINKLHYGGMTGGRHVAKEIEKTDIVTTQFFYMTKRIVSLFHKCEQYKPQQSSSIICGSA